MRIIPYSVGYKETWDSFLGTTRNGAFLLSRGFLDYHAEELNDCSVLVYAEEAMGDNADDVLGTDGLLALFPATWNPEEKKVYTHQSLGYGGLLIRTDTKITDVLQICQAIFSYYSNFLQAKTMVYSPLPYIYNQFPTGDELYSLFQAGAKLQRRRVSMVVPLKKQQKLPSLKNVIARKAVDRGMYISRLLIDDEEEQKQYVELLQGEDSVISLTAFNKASTLEVVKELIARFPKYIRYYVVKNQEGIQAGSMVLFMERVAYVQQMVCSEYGRQNGALELLLKHLTTECFASADYLDMGSSYVHNSTLDRSLLFVKESFGGRAVCYDTYELKLDRLNLDKMASRATKEDDGKIPYSNLKLQNDTYEPLLTEVVSNVVTSGRYVLGENVAAFEQEFAGYCGAQHCVAVGSGLDAMRLMLLAYKIKEGWVDGDEVIVPSNSFSPDLMSVLQAGLTPVLCEPQLEDGMISAKNVEELITDRTRAILGVHVYGQLCDVDELASLAGKHGLCLLEDAGHAHGAEKSDGRRAGHLGDAAAFSFRPSMNLGALGDAGAVVTDDDEVARIVRTLSISTDMEVLEHHMSGTNSKMDEFQAAVLRVKLRRLDEDNAVRRAVAERYYAGINNPLVVLQRKPRFEGEHVYHIFAVRCRLRDELRKFLASKGIETMTHLPAYPQIRMGEGCEAVHDYPVAQRFYDEELSLPLSPVLKDEEIERIIKVVNEFNVEVESL